VLESIFFDGCILLIAERIHVPNVVFWFKSDTAPIGRALLSAMPKNKKKAGCSALGFILPGVMIPIDDFLLYKGGETQGHLNFDDKTPDVSREQVPVASAPPENST
jgi:hypothetical protein